MSLRVLVVSILMISVMFFGLTSLNKGCSNLLDKVRTEQRVRTEQENQAMADLGFVPADARAFFRSNLYNAEDFINSKVVQKKFKVWAGIKNDN